MPAPERGGYWGILGGTFDPVHRGHVGLALEVCRARDLDGVLFVPSHRHPFKGDRGHAAYLHRVAMLRLALADHDPLRVEEIEAEEALSGYTIDTVRALKRKYTQATFAFIIGADLLDQVESWHDHEGLLQETTILAGARPGFQLKGVKALPQDRVALVETETAPISSTALRALIAGGEPHDALAKWVPEDVLVYIEKEQLYR